MDFDNSWDALLKPGTANRYFDFDRRTPFATGNVGYNPGNALWLAELSRLVYRDEAVSPNRDQLLREVRLREAAFFDRNGTQAALVVADDQSGTAFSAVIFRGTSNLEDWLTNLNTRPVAWPGGGRVHQGFKEALERVWEEIVATLDGLDAPLFFAGHSLGAALATLATAKRAPTACYTFGSPRVGDGEFADTLRDYRIYRVVNNHDIVTTVPPSERLMEFTHVGELRYITHRGQMLVEPAPHIVAFDRLQTLYASLQRQSDQWRLSNPPDFLSDHAPGNYVAQLERLLAST